MDTKTTEWTNRESNTIEYQRLTREQDSGAVAVEQPGGHMPFDHAGQLWAVCDACWAISCALPSRDTAKADAR